MNIFTWQRRYAESLSGSRVKGVSTSDKIHLPSFRLPVKHRSEREMHTAKCKAAPALPYVPASLANSFPPPAGCAVRSSPYSGRVMGLRRYVLHPQGESASP